MTQSLMMMFLMFQVMVVQPLVIKKEPLRGERGQMKKMNSPRVSPLTDAAKEERLVREVVTHRRKNSYKRAQESEIIEIEMRESERRKSFGHLEGPGKRIKSNFGGRASSSMDNILTDDTERFVSFQLEEGGRIFARQGSNNSSSMVELNEESLKSSAKRERSCRPRSRTGVSSLEDVMPPERPQNVTTRRSKSGSVGEALGHHPTTSNATSSKLKSSYHYERHPLSHSTTSILDDSTEDPHPILPNRYPGTPDVWLPIQA